MMEYTYKRVEYTWREWSIISWIEIHEILRDLGLDKAKEQSIRTGGSKTSMRTEEQIENINSS